MNQVIQQPVVSSAETTEHSEVLNLHSQILREHNEPRDGFEPIPQWLMMFFGIMLFWGGFYTAQYSGGFRGDVFNETSNLVAGGGPKKAADLPLEKLGELKYGLCASCHQATGLGQPNNNIPPLAGSNWVEGSPARLIRILLHGLQGPIYVKTPTNPAGTQPSGLPWGQGPNAQQMPAWNTLSDRDIAGVLTYIRKQWGNNASEITPDMVKTVRDKVGARGPWTEAELLAVPADEIAAGAAASPAAPGPGGDAAPKSDGGGMKK